MSTPTKRVMPASVKTLRERTFETTITTGAVDRARDTIDPAGWKLDAYMRSPVILRAHDYTVPPIAKTLSITRTATGLRSVDQFPPTGVYPFADQIHDLVKAGMINAKSVGFIPLRKTWNAKREGWDISEAELLEHSYCSVPANPEALVVARSKGLDRARLDAFLRGAACDLDVSEADVRVAVREGVTEEVERRVRWAMTPADAQVLELDDEIDLDSRDVVAALREALPEMVGAALAKARGRID